MAWLRKSPSESMYPSTTSTSLSWSCHRSKLREVVPIIRKYSLLFLMFQVLYRSVKQAVGHVPVLRVLALKLLMLTSMAGLYVSLMFNFRKFLLWSHVLMLLEIFYHKHLWLLSLLHCYTLFCKLHGAE